MESLRTPKLDQNINPPQPENTVDANIPNTNSVPETHQPANDNFEQNNANVFASDQALMGGIKPNKSKGEKFKGFSMNFLSPKLIIVIGLILLLIGGTGYAYINGYFDISRYRGSEEAIVNPTEKPTLPTRNASVKSNLSEIQIPVNVLDDRVISKILSIKSETNNLKAVNNLITIDINSFDNELQTLARK